ncbi:MAG: electron transport complex subunit RsxC [Acetivibrio sp.]
MTVGTFKGGTHPFEGKNLSKDLPTKVVLPKGELVYPMAQHIGAPAKPMVSIGDKVLVGQKIAAVQGFVSANICCSVSGTVKGIEQRRTVSGSMSESIIIENDNAYTPIAELGRKRKAEQLSKEEIRDIVKEAGIVGMGGAGFPTHIKLTPKEDSSIDYILVNGAECEPYLTSDYRMMLEEPEKIVGGLRVILRLFEKAKGLICIEDNKPEAISKLRELVKNESQMEIKILKTKYPQGAERQVIYAATGRKINSSMLPSDVGCIVNNIDTVIAVYMAVCETTPLIRRIVTVTGDAIKTPQNFNVKTGTNYAELLEEAGGLISQPEKIVSGGPMMGMALFDLNIPVTKTSSALLCLTHDEAAEQEPTACIRCGRCVEVCPSRLIPQKMLSYAEAFDDEGFQKIYGMECYECGSCTYVCPTKRRLTQAFKQTRRSIMANKKK